MEKTHVGDNITAGFARELRSVTGTCPFCGGKYAAGYLKVDGGIATIAKAQGIGVIETPGGALTADIRHSIPPCELYESDPRRFLTEANKRCRDKRPIK